MIVITLERCPAALRGDLTKWLQEISPGVYVGQVSARVRDKLWERVCGEAKNGRATMAFTTRGEQRYDFRVHNASWEPIDFDGLKLMMRPSPARVAEVGSRKAGFSDASARARGRGGGRRQPGGSEPPAFAVVDVETTGLDCEKDAIIEMAALKVVGGEVVGSWERLVRADVRVPDEVARMTGITAEMLARDGVPLEDALDGLFDIVGNLPIVGHNVAFDVGFLQAACDACGFGDLDNDCIDTLQLSRKRLPQLGGHKLEDLARYFGVANEVAHRAMSDCRVELSVFRKLNEIR